jgi:hypothetical protein
MSPVESIEQGKELESGEPGYTGCSRLKGRKTILMIVMQVARDVRVGENEDGGMGRATKAVVNVNF